MTPLLALIVIAYLLGSVPFGLLIGKSQGKDLRKIGSGNIGATNAGRTLGKKWGYTCFLLDCMKGFIPTFCARGLLGGDPTVTQLSLWLAVGCAAILGHVFPVYLRFKGGKGVATSLGMVLGLYPYFTVAGIVAAIVWVAFVLIWRYVSLASIAAAVAFPAVLIIAIALNKDSDWQFIKLWPLVIVALIMPALVVVRHAENIKRLLEGSESKVMQK